MTIYEKLLTYSLGIISKKRYTKKQIKDKLIARVKKIQSYSSKNSFKLKNHNINNKGDLNTPLVVDDNTILNVIERLVELKYIDDKRFSEDYISQRILLRPRGARLIRVELLKKGINSDIINNAIDSTEINEEEMVQRVFDKKFGRFNRNDIDYYKFKSKVFTHLFSKGFSKDYIYKVFDSWYNNSV